MEEEMNKQTRRVLLIIGVIIIIFFSINYFMKNNKPNTQQDIPEITAPIIKETGLGDLINVGKLSFQLYDVELFQPGSSGQSNLWWKYVITNNGEEIEKVSDCGILLFEDSSQYDIQINEYSSRGANECNEYTLVPGAKGSLWFGFQFSEDNGKLWKDIPGSKITFFSQQDYGLVKYTIDKSNINYTNQK